MIFASYIFMIRISVSNYIRLGALLCALVVIADGQAAKTTRAQSKLTRLHVCAPCVHAHMEFLASDALRGRGSGTPDEWVAATYIASELEQYGVAPAGEDGTYLQRATLLRQKLTSAPQLRFHTSGPPEREVEWTHGKQILALYLASPAFSGPLQKIDLAKGEKQPVQSGAVVFLTAPNGDQIRREQFRIGSEGAVAVLVPESSRQRLPWQAMGGKLPELPVQIEGADRSDMGPQFNVFAVSSEAGAVLGDLPDGTTIEMKATAGPVEKSHTWNAVGKISGTDSLQQHAAVLLTAHLDHLGVGAPVNGDQIYNGADDDASGTTAVLELARVLAAQPKPRRTVIFALFGSEEAGGLGSTYFREHPPVPLHDISASLEFEMIGRADSAVAEDTLWLTGWERSNLGPELARHGAHLVADPHPDQGFFQRSDNYVLAKKGVVAQTVSSYGLHGDYHQPSDDLAHIDFQHMNEAIHSMLRPVLWLVNSTFAPHWNRGIQP
jgi:aminopeptidase YwaD